MPSESRTFIQLTDILGVEFECPKCQAKILYPIKKHYEPLPEKCPSCGQVWFDENPNLADGQPRIVELVQKTLTSLHNISETPAIQARVRLNINDPLAERTDKQSEEDKKGSPAKRPSSEKAKAS
jgi:hypothetical protein